MGKTRMPDIVGWLNLCSGGIGLFAAFFWGMALMYPDQAFQILAVSLMFFSPVAAILAVLGGVYAFQRKKWGLAFAGSIAALSPILLTGIVSIILILRSKKAFT